MTPSPTRPDPAQRLATLAARVDFGLVLALLLCLLALWPLITQSGLPNGRDVLYHTYRVGEMDRAWTNGLLFPRWAEGLYYGYGSPLFHYYAGSTYYLSSLIIRVAGVDALNALRVVIVLAILSGGTGMYLFMRDQVNQLAGVIAALVYVYSPYFANTEPYARGDFPELLALALLPWLLWRFDRFVASERAHDAVLAALMIALIILTHNLTALIAFGLLVAWLLWQRLTGAIGWRPLILALEAAALGVGLAALFWLPVLLESGAVHLENLTGVALLDYRNFFVSPGDLLALSGRADAGSINSLHLRLNLGVAQWVLALGGIIGISYVLRSHGRTPRRNIPPSAWQGVFFVIVGVGTIFLITPLSDFLWSLIRPLAVLQFPWRFLGVAGFCLAILAGMNVVWIEQLSTKWRIGMIAGLVAAPILLALPTLFVPEWTNTAVDASLPAYHDAEVRGLQLGTTFTNEYLPTDTYTLASATPELLADYADGYPVDKANRSSLPENTVIDFLDHGPQHDEWQITTKTAFTLEVLTLYFAGWQAEIDGAPVTITPSPEHGFITVPVPEGEHTVRVYLGSTPARDASHAASALSAAGVVIMTLCLWRRGRNAASDGKINSGVQAYTVTGWQRGVIAGGVIALGLTVILMREGVMWWHSPPGTALPAQEQLRHRLGETLHLIGSDLSARELRPGETLELALYWYASEPVPYQYQTFVHVTSGGPPVAQADRINPAGRPTTMWTTDGYVRDDYAISLPETMPPGEYQLLVGLYTCETLPPGDCGNGDRLPVRDADGNDLGDAVPLGTILVR